MNKNNQKDHRIRKSRKKTYENVIEEIEKLNLNHSLLDIFPHCIFKLTSLTNLSLSNNSLEKIPEEIGKLVNLRRLDISDNRLKEIPKSLVNLKRLISLDANNNLLTGILHEIGRLQNLFELDLSYNRIKTIPLSLGFCNKLRRLHLDYNYLLEIPNNLVFLSKLRYLLIERNQLIYLPSLPFPEKVLFIYRENAYLNYYSLSFTQTRFHYHDIENTRSFKNYVSNLILEIHTGSEVKHIILNRMYKNVYRMSETYFPSLLEITLRLLWNKINTKFLYRTYFHEHKKLPIPTTLTHILLNGPIDKCAMCHSFIFLESVMWIVQKPSRTGYILLTVNFCSTACAEAFRTKEQSNELSNDSLSANMMPWDVINYKSLIRKRAREHDTFKEILKKMKFNNIS